MTSRKSFKDGLQFAWDSTSVTSATTCLRKYEYEILEGWQKITVSHHLTFGGHYAKALERFYKFQAEGMSQDDAENEVIGLAMCETWIYGQPWDSLDTNKNRTTLIRSIIWYIAEFGDESESNIKTFILPSGKPACELSFSFELAEAILYCGHIDRVVTYGDAPFVMDQKTTAGTISPYFFDKFKPDIQFSGYTLAGKIVLETPVRGVIIDAAQIAVGFTRFMRDFTYRTEAELAEWTRNTKETVETARSATARNFFPMNVTACSNYGGCPFRQVCASDPRMRQHELESNFIRREKLWDPLENR